MRDTIAQTRFENVINLSNDSLLTKTTQALEITSLKRRFKKLKKKQRRKIHDIDADEDITLVNNQHDAEMFDVNDLHGEEVFVEKEVTDKEVSVVALVEIKTSKPKAKGIVLQEPSESTTTTTTKTISSKQSQDKSNAIMIEEPVKLKKKDQIRLDEEAALKLQAELQAEEQQELTDAKKDTLFIQFLEKRRKFFAAKRIEEKRNKPPTHAQQRKIMCTYLKNMEGKKLKDLKNKSFDSIQKMFDRAFNRQKVDDDKETAKLKELIEIIPDKEEVAIDAIPLAIKSPKIVDWKIHKEGKKRYYQIIRADGKSKMYMVFNLMLKEFDGEDLKDLYNLVKSKYESTKPVEDLDLLL
uniref:Uncharacterized protein n=1 Tax=Tanacetum cinerariifolium TaxID=118510 RepID=A0A6L2NQK2_TANCI|nr:hypothetical protein [Tanacetum cinerariifolium]